MGVEHNFDNAAEAFKKLPENLQDAADESARKTASNFVRDSMQAMQDNGSVETGKGLRSLEYQELGEGKYGVFGNSYLKALDRGTTPHQPDQNNPRFSIWARSHGFTRDELAALIADQGTKPRPWINKAAKRSRARKNDIVKIEIEDALQKTSRIIK